VEQLALPLLLIFSYFLLLLWFSGLFPESQDAASDAIEEFRQQQVAIGVVLVEPVAWAMEDYVIDFLAQVLVVARTVFKVLWPEAMVPTSGLQVTQWLATALGCIDDWRASAARAGAEMALYFVLSWYEEVRLDQLETRRAGAATMSDAGVAELHT
jgi:hypothetical protein